MKVLNQVAVDEAVRSIAEQLQPDAIYLYGSFAYGQPHEDSDIDLLVVVPDDRLSLRGCTALAYRALRGLFLPAELKVVYQSGFKHRAHWQSSIERQAVDKGIILYEAGRSKILD